MIDICMVIEVIKILDKNLKLTKWHRVILVQK